jgi:anion transporter
MIVLPACATAFERAMTCGTPRLPQVAGSYSTGLSSRWRIVACCTCAIGLPATIWYLPQDLSRDARIALIVLALAVIGWAVTRLNDTLIGLAAALTLAATGVLSSDKLFSVLGHELIWLLVAAFIISAVLRASGLLEWLAFAMLPRLATVKQLFLGLTGVIAATAFVIPSTSGRAVLMLPVFLALAERIGSERIIRALALLFPTTILLSAGGLLIGAGAHIVAADFIERAAGERTDYFGWMAMALPFALLSSLLAALTILRLFLTSEEASRPLQLGPVRRAGLTRQQLVIASIVLATVGLWMAVPLHGLSLALIALMGALTLLLPGMAPLTESEAFKAVNVELVVFVASTFAIAEALSQSGADTWLARGIVQMLPPSISRSTSVIVALVVLVSLLAHLVIASRTARTAVLIPALALPLAGLGHDPKLLILVTVLGTGFCQTLVASAKPVALFAMTERPTYTSGDLLRLSAALLPILFALLVLFALTVWS